jgi:putative flippase GtrA
MSQVLIQRAARFGLSGILVTALHAAIAVSFIELVFPNPPLANGIAYAIATVASYLINTLWSFSSPLQRQSFLRFLFVSGVGFSLTVTIAWLADLAGFSYWMGIACVVAIVPPVTFLMHAYWTYRLDTRVRIMQRLPIGPPLAIPTALGFIAFLLITGGRILSPTYVDWLMEGDPATHFLGWHFFRNTPFFQWPLGANPGYGAEMSSSIVFSDSVPLFAFLFKPFSAFLSVPFQYSGIWILLCFILQAVFAWQLLGKVTGDNWLKSLGTGFFIVAPPFLWRLHGHYALMAQWLLLAALLLYLSAKSSNRRWLLLLAIAPVLHLYLLAMVLPIWLADLMKRLLQRETTKRQAAVALLSGTVVVAAVMWISGYFMLPARASALGGFGVYRMNLLSLIDSDVHWSRLLKDQAGGTGDYEGFNFLGLGVLLLAVIAATELIRAPLRGMRWRGLVPLLIVAFLLTVFALSNQITLGDRVLLSYPLPAFVQSVVDAFRCSGRFFWPVYYLILLSVLLVIVTRMGRRPAIVLLTTLLALQIFDSSAVSSMFYRKFAAAPVWQSPLRSEFWTAAANKYNKIIYILPKNMPENYLPLGYYAGAHGMAMNAGYLVRFDYAALVRARARVADTVVSGELDNDALYVFASDQKLWDIVRLSLKESDRAGIVDGFRVLAPGWASCSACVKSADLNPSPTAILPRYKSGTPMRFNNTGNSDQYRLLGWSIPESWGTWSEGFSAAIGLALDSPALSDLRLELTADGYVNERHPAQTIEVSANGRSIGSLRFTQAAPSGTSVLIIPREAAAGNNNQIVIRFKIMNPASPARLGLSSDPRLLGIGLRSLSITETDGPKVSAGYKRD